MSEQAGRYPRSAAGLVAAMLVLVAVVAGYVVVRDLLRTTPETPVRTVDYRAAAEHAGREATFDVLAPVPLPEGWRSTSATYTPLPAERWHLGVLTDEGSYVGLEQARMSAEAAVEEFVDEDASRGETIEIRGVDGLDEWVAFTDDGGDAALVRRKDGLTTLLVGTVDQAVLVDYAESLR